MPLPRLERRRSARRLCSHLVEVSCDGSTRGLALLEDISPEGAAVALEQPILADSEVELRTTGFHARARVRYCLARENDFRLGLEFSDGARWNPRIWQPEHLFLPPP